MHNGKFVFAQIAEFLPRRQFKRCVDKYRGDCKIRKLTCREQFLCQMFGQLTNLNSLRGVVLSLNAHASEMYHLGFRSKKLVLSTITRANESRNWQIYRDLANILIVKARKLYANDKGKELGIDLEGNVYVLDSTMIELCLSLFKWAYFERETAALRIHTQLDLKANIPSFFLITTAKVHDVNFLDMIDIEAGAYYVMDRGYIDLKRLHHIHEEKAYFVIRAKSRLSFTRLYSQPVDKSTGLKCDQTIRFDHFYSRKNYPGKIRRVKYYDQETDTCYVYLTNNFDLDAATIVELYHNRWQIELFFKWIKQHLHINVYWGCSKNAIQTQICIAICTYLIIAIMKKQMNIDRSLHEILQILSVSLFEKTPVNTLLSEFDLQNFEDQAQKRLFSLGF